MMTWTDPDYTLTVNGINLTTVRDIHVTFSQPDQGIKIDVTDVTVIDESHLQCSLTQEQTGLFKAFRSRIFEPHIECMINMINSEGKRRYTDKKVLKLEDNLLTEVIGNEHNQL